MTPCRQSADRQWEEILPAAYRRGYALEKRRVGNLLGIVLQTRHGQESDTVVGAIVEVKARPGTGN
jgi:hypothetical protein